MKKIIISIIISFLIIGDVFAIDKSELDYLNNLGVNIDKSIFSKKQVSRYEAIKYLNYAQCFDCIFPPKEKKEILNYGWFQKFKKQDKVYLDDIYSQDKYYYCVTNLAKLDYIHGFPKTNPVCSGKFCGSNTLSFGELFQIIVNILSPKIWSDYTIDDIDIFYTNLLKLKGTQEEKSVNILPSDYSLVKKLHDKYDGSYTLSNFNEFFLYQKYCNIYPEDCSFKYFGDIKKGNEDLSLLNILHNAGLITTEQGMNFNPVKKVSGEDLIKWLYKVKKISACKVDNDYDKDGIVNKNDNSIYVYNPNQKDTDHDGIGDVSDNDIDGDGVKNPIGIVDDDGNIVISKITSNMDNCLFVPNSNQKDLNHNGIGDVCEKKGLDLIGIEITCSPLKGDTPFKTTCKAKTKGSIKQIVWTYNGQVIGRGKNIDYTFKNPGNKNITATAIGQNNSVATANSYFKVGRRNINKTLEVGLEVFANPTSGPEGTKVLFKPQVRGNIDFIKWNFGDGTVYKRSSNKNLLKMYKRSGSYKVIARAYKNNKVVGISYLYINIYKRLRKPNSYLQAEPLIGFKNQDITFKLKLKNLDKENIEKVVWNFGDGVIRSTSTTSIQYHYKQAGGYGVRSTIYTQDGQVIDNFITEKIVDTQTNKKYGVYIKADPLKQKIGKKVKFMIIPKGIKNQDIKKIIWNFGDGTKTTTYKLTNTHLYYKEGKKNVITNIILKNQDNIQASLTEVIYGEDVCLNKNNSLKCDMDHDGIPDICDDDIDGDGVKNLLGIIKYEKKDCSITYNNIEKLKLEEQQNLAKNGGSIDNCPFTKNANQIDVNNNGIGDACKNDGYDFIGIQAKCSPLKGNEPLKITCNAYTEGNIKNIIWTYNGQVIGRGKNIGYTFINPGNKNIIATVIGQNNDTATANIYFKIGKKDNQDDKKYGAYIKADPLKQKIGKKVKFTIIPKGIKNQDIEKIKWNFGDGTSAITTNFFTTHIYYKNGTKPVIGTIILKNKKNITISLTEVIYGQDIYQKDTDHDGIPDNNDTCIDIPENYNGVEDEDGCPELPKDITNNLSLTVDNCNTCPCQFADYATPFILGLKLRTLLVNPSNPSHIYKISDAKIVR